MTTPPNNPDPGSDPNAPQPPAGSGPARPEPQYGQYAPGPYGSAGAPYGYQAAQPSGYAYPGPSAMGQPKGPAPREVITGSWLILAAGVLALINNIITSFDLPSMLTSDEKEALAESGAATESINAFLTSFGIAVAVIGFAFYVLIGVFVRKGKNWARILGTVFAALSLLSMLTMLGSYFSSPLGVLSLLSSLLGIAGIVMLYLAPSTPYFRRAPLYPY